MNAHPAYKPRFLTPEQANELLHYWRMTSVGHAVLESDRDITEPTNRYGRMIRTARLMHKAYPSVTVTAAYKDLDGLLGPFTALIMS